MVCIDWQFLMSLGFTKSDVYSNLYYKVVDYHPVIFMLYVNDVFLVGLPWSAS